jgi:hypothetical protein
MDGLSVGMREIIFKRIAARGLIVPINSWRNIAFTNDGVTGSLHAIRYSQ